MGWLEYPGEIKNKCYAKFGGRGGGKPVVLSEMCEWRMNTFLAFLMHLINTLDSKNFGVSGLFQIWKGFVALFLSLSMKMQLWRSLMEIQFVCHRVEDTRKETLYRWDIFLLSACFIKKASFDYLLHIGIGEPLRVWNPWPRLGQKET